MPQSVSMKKRTMYIFMPALVLIRSLFPTCARSLSLAIRCSLLIRSRLTTFHSRTPSTVAVIIDDDDEDHWGERMTMFVCSTL